MFDVPVERKLSITVDFSDAAWNTVGSHELFTVSGVAKVKLLAHCTEIIATEVGATIQLGVEGETDNLIAATTGVDIDANELWYDATPTTQIDTPPNAILERVVNDLDVGYEIAVDAFTDGNIQFVLIWEEIEPGASISIGAGGAL